MSYEFEWPTAASKADETILDKIRKHGCTVIGISRDDEGPPYAFSVGLFANYAHPELIIFGLRSENAQGIINDVRDRIATGHKFADGDISDDIVMDGYKLCFWNVPLMVYGDYLGTAIWFYSKAPRPFPCLQIIWQDPNRKFPWEAGCLPEIKADQPLLKKAVS